MPDPAEPGVWEFLGMKPFVRGQLFIGLLRILRDDLPLDPNSPGHGIGWTELCTSRDGENWTWHHKPYLDRSADHPDAQDHASAYASECITVGDQDYIYFAASRGGHKTNSSVLALAKQPKNRFVSRDAGDTAAVLLTPLLVLNARTMTLNADVRGRLNVRLLNEDDQPIAGFETPSNEPIAGDSLAHKVNFPKSITTLAARPVRIEFTLQNASVFGFDLEK